MLERLKCWWRGVHVWVRFTKPPGAEKYGDICWKCGKWRGNGMSTKYIPIRVNDGYYGPTEFREVSPALAGLLASLPPWPKPFKKGERERWLTAFRIIVEQDYAENENRT